MTQAETDRIQHQIDQTKALVSSFEQDYPFRKSLDSHPVTIRYKAIQLALEWVLNAEPDQSLWTYVESQLKIQEQAIKEAHDLNKELEERDNG